MSSGPDEAEARRGVTRLREAWRTAVTAELCWTGADGSPSAIAVTPLVHEGSVCVALPYSRAAQVESLRAGRTATFCVTDSRSTGGEPGLAASGPVTVVDDVEGEVLADGLLEQELAKYPPSRTLADSVLLRREHWWWLPRIVIRLDGPGAVTPLPARTNPARHALALTSDGTPRCVDLGDLDGLDGVDGVGDRSGPAVRDLSGAPLPDGPTLMLGYDYTMPDLERWETWAVSGTVAGGALKVSARNGEPGADLPPLGLLARTRRHRQLGKDCRSGLRAAERRVAPTSEPTS